MQVAKLSMKNASNSTPTTCTTSKSKLIPTCLRFLRNTQAHYLTHHYLSIHDWMHTTATLWRYRVKILSRPISQDATHPNPISLLTTKYHSNQDAQTRKRFLHPIRLDTTKTTLRNAVLRFFPDPSHKMPTSNPNIAFDHIVS